MLNPVRTSSSDLTLKAKIESTRVMSFVTVINLWFLFPKFSRLRLIYLNSYHTSQFFQRATNASFTSTQLLTNAQLRRSSYPMRRVKREWNVWRNKSPNLHVASPRSSAASRLASPSLWRSTTSPLSSAASLSAMKAAPSLSARCLSISPQKILEERP